MSDDEKSSYGSGSDSDSEAEMMDGKTNAFKGRKVILPKIPGRKLGSDEEDADDAEEEEDDEDADDAEEEEDDDDADDADDVDYSDEAAVANKVFDNIPQVAVGNKKKKAADTSAAVEFDVAAYEDDDEEEDDEEDEDETGEKYLQKLDELTKRNIIGDYHPELQQHNHDEIESLSVVVRDDHGNIIDPFHRTVPFLTKYEKARMLGERSRQLDAGAKPLVEVETGIIDSYLIAVAELEQKKIPFIVKRPLMNGGCEYWKLKDLEYL